MLFKKEKMPPNCTTGSKCVLAGLFSRQTGEPGHQILESKFTDFTQNQLNQ